MRQGYELIEEIFGEEGLELVSELRHGDILDVKNHSIEITDNIGWYNHYQVKFDLNEKRYVFKYKEHTSDNVCDSEIFFDTFACLGSVSELEEVITKEDVALIKMNYEKRIQSLEQQLSSLKKKSNLFSEPYKQLKVLTPEQVNYVGSALIQSHEANPKAVTTIIGNFLLDIERMKNNGDL